LEVGNYWQVSQISRLKYRRNFLLKCDYFTTSPEANENKQNKEEINPAEKE